MGKEYPIIEIEWRDAYSHADWRKPSKAEDAIMRTAGYLVREDEKYTVITQTISPEGEIAHTISIPRNKVILKIRKLK